MSAPTLPIEVFSKLPSFIQLIYLIVKIIIFILQFLKTRFFSFYRLFSLISGGCHTSVLFLTLNVLLPLILFTFTFLGRWAYNSLHGINLGVGQGV